MELVISRQPCKKSGYLKMQTLKIGDHVILLDDDSFAEWQDRRISVSKNKNMFYARSGRVYLHRAICLAGKGEIVDHINGNGLDNRRENLRIVSRQANKANQKFGLERKTSKYIGVGSVSGRNLFRVSIKVAGKVVTIGYFKNEVDAALAYDKSALERFGKMAFLNFPANDNSSSAKIAL